MFNAERDGFLNIPLKEIQSSPEMGGENQTLMQLSKMGNQLWLVLQEMLKAKLNSWLSSYTVATQLMRLW